MTDTCNVTDIMGWVVAVQLIYLASVTMATVNLSPGQLMRLLLFVPIIGLEIAAYRVSISAAMIVISIGCIVLGVVVSHPFAGPTELDAAAVLGRSIAKSQTLQMKLPVRVSSDHGFEIYSVTKRLRLVPATIDVDISTTTRIKNLLEAVPALSETHLFGSSNAFEYRDGESRYIVYIDWADDLYSLRSLPWMTAEFYEAAAHSYTQYLNETSFQCNLAVSFSDFDDLSDI